MFKWDVQILFKGGYQNLEIKLNQLSTPNALVAGVEVYKINVLPFLKACIKLLPRFDHVCA